MRPIRVYTVSFAASAQTGAIDFFEFLSTSSRGIILLSVHVGQLTETGDAMEEQLDWYVKRHSGAYSTGTGTTATPRPVASTDATATFTAKTVMTVKGSGGTAVTMHDDAFNVRAGIKEIWTPETQITTAVSEALTIGLTSAPADSVTWKGTAYVGELL